MFCTYTFADFNAQVVRVIDGDTIQVKDNLGHKFKIRLLGIDTPEIKQAFGKESSDYLKSIVTGKKILIISKPDNDKPYTLDFYKRVLAKVILNGKDINLEMVKKGMPWHYKKYKNNQPFDD